jgi:hypothetical protein
MRKIAIIVIVLMLVDVGFLTGCEMATRCIYTEKMSKGSYRSVNMTEEQMEKFPHLKESILTNKSVNLASDNDINECDRLSGILEYFNTKYIYYQNEYYKIDIKFLN